MGIHTGWRLRQRHKRQLQWNRCGQNLWWQHCLCQLQLSCLLGNGVLHAFDTPAIFGPYYQGSIVEATIQVHPFSTYDASIVPIEMIYYISFVRSLSPNNFRAEQSHIWEPFEGKHGKQRSLLEINDTRMGEVPKVQQDQCAFWYSLAAIDGE